MTRIRPTGLLFCCFTLTALLASPALGQFKEAYEPPGFVLEWGSQGTGDGQFDFPTGVAVDASGNVYVLDGGNRRIQKFDSVGNYLTQWDIQGVPADESSRPVGVAADASGNVYLVDINTHSVQKFDSVGNYLDYWGALTSGFPAGVAADPYGHIYAVDNGNYRVQKFDTAGNYITQWGSQGSSVGQFEGPRAVAADASGNIYVADPTLHRVQKFDSEGNYLTEWGSYGSGDGQFEHPSGVAIDALGNVYVAESVSARIQKFDSAGNYLTKWGSFGSSEGKFFAPAGVAVDPSGNVYVADTGNHRIQKFAPVLWFDLAGYDSLLSAAASHETTAVRTIFQLENNGAPRFAFKNTNSDIEWSFQQSGPGNFLISREGTGGPEMQVYQNGRVRMGPSGAANFDLAPNGNLTIAGSLTANGSTFPDYVFGPDYRLMSLEDVATFIEREKRLPGVPSAEKIQQQGGHNMTELQLKLLEKVEELTLYTLEQEQRLQKKDDEIQQLEADLSWIRRVLDSEGRVQ